MKERDRVALCFRPFLVAILASGWWVPDFGCAQTSGDGEGAVTIEYVAHACFRVTSPGGKRVLIDPYASRVWLGYDFPTDVRADAVLISHPHYDHDGGAAMGRPVPWPPQTLVLREPGTNQIGDITVTGFAGKHADPWGKEFGQSNTIWVVEAAGLRIVHLGDNGPLSEATIGRLGRVDVLMMPIDSQFHILKAEEIATIRDRLAPRVLIPMHYRLEDLEVLPDKPDKLGAIEGWAKAEVGVRYLAGNTHSFSPASLPRKAEVLIFKHSPLVTRPPKATENVRPVEAGAPDLLGPAVAFRHMHNRWPKNYRELVPLIQGADGKGQVGGHDRVEFKELPDGGLDIYWEGQGQTNRITLPVQ